MIKDQGNINKCSVIIPVFNGESYIKPAYNEIIRQEIKLPFELIFVDNNSTDNSKSEIKDIIAQDNRVHLFRAKTQGAGAAKNKGIEEATGNFIYFFDVDDRLFPDAINVLIEILVKYPNLDSVFGDLTRDIYQLENFITKGDIYNPKQIQKPKQGLFWFTHFSKLVGPPAFLNRKKVFDDIGFFPEEILIGEDAAFHIRLGLFKNIGYVNRLVYFYNRHPDSTVSRIHNKQDYLYTYWEQYVKHYIPYYQNHERLEIFKTILKRKVFASFVKMIKRKQGFKSRQQLNTRLKAEISPLNIPIWLQFLISILVLSASDFVLKIALKLIVKSYKTNFSVVK